MRRPSTRVLLVAVLLMALVLAGVLSFHASASPDGLARVAGDLGLASAERPSVVAGGPLADYEVAGLDDPRLAGGLAGVVGCMAVLGLSTLLFRRAHASSPATRTSHEDGE